jgi:hypothetical protein
MTTPFLTAGRLALAGRLRADTVLADRVRTWRTAEAAPRRHPALEPADCPALELAPSLLEPEVAADRVDSLPQDLAVTITAEGPDAAPCEDLVSAVLDCLTLADADRLGLADDGLVSVRQVRVAWRRYPTAGNPRACWQAELTVRLTWLRTSI